MTLKKLCSCNGFYVQLLSSYDENVDTSELIAEAKQIILSDYNACSGLIALLLLIGYFCIKIFKRSMKKRSKLSKCYKTLKLRKSTSLHFYLSINLTNNIPTWSSKFKRVINCNFETFQQLR